MRLLILTMAFAGACSGEHLVGSVQLCCFDVQANLSVPSCDNLPNCICQLELCGAGSVCRSDSDCPPMIAKPLLACVGCISGRCAPKPACPALPSTGPSTCNSDSQCNQLGGCAMCADKSMACYVVRCLGGLCITQAPSCGCRSDSDCVVPPNACESCPDGVTKRCLETRCAGGQCLVQPGAACPATASCRVDGDCGAAPCLSCSSGKVCGSIWCAAGSCQTIPPSC